MNCAMQWSMAGMCNEVCSALTIAVVRGETAFCIGQCSAQWSGKGGGGAREGRRRGTRRAEAVPLPLRKWDNRLGAGQSRF